MRVAVAGKGGSGKTTIAGVIARTLGRRAGTVLAIDDDSNPNLAVTLGISREKAESIPHIPGDILQSYTALGGKTALRLSLPVDEIVAKFGVEAPDNVRLLVVGRVEHAGVG